MNEKRMRKSFVEPSAERFSVLSAFFYLVSNLRVGRLSVMTHSARLPDNVIDAVLSLRLLRPVPSLKAPHEDSNRNGQQSEKTGTWLPSD